MSRTIFDITDDMLALGDLLDNAGGEINDPQVEEAIMLWSDELENDLQAKVESYCWLMREKESRSLAMFAEADRLRERAQSNQRAARGLRDRLLFAFTLKGIDKVDTSNFTVGIARNGGKQPIDIDSDAVTDDYLTSEVVKTVNKDKIREALDAGVELDFASMLERGTHLRVK